MFKRKAVNRKNRRINRRKDSSRGRLKIRDTHINTKFLDAVFSPAIKIKKHYNGVNSATWHSSIDTNSYDASVDPKFKLFSVSGDCNSLQCLPGRQIYVEFMMFPQRSWKNSGYEYANTNKLDCLGTDICSMMDKAFQFSNITGMSAYNFNNNDFMSSQVTKFTDILNSGFNQTTAYSADESKLRQTQFNYEGGSHVHEFTNPSNMPIYVELIEYKPRNLMYYSVSSFASDASGTIDVVRLPGLYETIHSDRLDQKAWDWNTGLPVDTANGANILTGNANGAADNTKSDKYFNELDDKGFKYSGKMPLTNLRWKILNKVTVRIDPGQVYKYTVEHKPFRFTPAELMQYNNNYRLHALTDGASLTYTRQAGAYAFNPLFSKGLAIRVTGSKSFITGSTGSSQFNSFGLDTNGGEFVNNVQPNTKNDKTSIVNPPIKAMVTHPAVITHVCTESHKFRMRAKPDNNIKFLSDYRPNAGSQNDVLTSDITAQMNPLTNDLLTNDFDN